MMVPALMWGTMVYTNNSIFNINFFYNFNSFIYSEFPGNLPITDINAIYFFCAMLEHTISKPTG